MVGSDMHIGDHDPNTARFFFDALNRSLPGHSHLILLGDLFEAWPGDDQTDPLAIDLLGLLATIGERGTTVFVMHGNRDFLLDVPIPAGDQTSFTALTGAQMLPDPTRLSFDGEPLDGEPVGPNPVMNAEPKNKEPGLASILLMHGDSLCTDDAPFQAFRAVSRQTDWQQQFLSQPLARRMQLARAYREESKETVRRRLAAADTHNASANEPKSEISDVNQQAVETVMSDAGCRQLLHGHTHRPMTHDWQFKGVQRQRYVLPDWDANEPRGGFMRLTASGVQRLAW
ncbi:MAG: UDP-2,3-diacylglucosamine diphosphatase [Burkholderiaceae bacterium]